MKSFVKTGFYALWKYSGLMRLQETFARWRRGPFMAVLLFHRVTDAIPEDGLTVSTARFRRMCRLLRRRFHVVPLAEVFRLTRSGEPIPRRTVAITFDDCYRDNLFAARVLAEHRLPACFFVPSGYVGTDQVFPWDRDLPQLPNLTWDDVREMAGMGFEIGSHTVTHPDMAAVPLAQARSELVESKRTIEDKIDRPVRWFAFPFGGREHCPGDRLSLLVDAGYEGSVSAYGGFVYPDEKSLIIPRVAAPDFKQSLLHLELYLAGCMHFLYALRPYRSPLAGSQGEVC
ncbi:MAG TPA: polysaccharide deacetylase family protein [Gemmataceae bacterium]|nr:polysaccharide deacetylase family protein [Gemmataceae bacterium]